MALMVSYDYGEILNRFTDSLRVSTNKITKNSGNGMEVYGIAICTLY